MDKSAQQKRYNTKSKSSGLLNTYIRNTNITDVWRIANPSGREYSFQDLSAEKLEDFSKTWTPFVDYYKDSMVQHNFGVKSNYGWVMGGEGCEAGISSPFGFFSV